jgi:hypothetical protein
MNKVELYIDSDVKLSEMDEYDMVKNIQMIFNTQVGLKRIPINSKYELRSEDKYLEAEVSNWVEDYFQMNR